jgi:hypothetical protein
MHFNKSASDITYLLACFVTYFRTHSLVWMCKLPLEQMHSLTCMDVQTSTWATNALTHLYGCANFHLSNNCTHLLTCMDVQTSTWAKWHEINMWNTWREYELKLGAFGGHDLCGGGGGGGGFLFNMTKWSLKPNPPAKTKKKGTLQLRSCCHFQSVAN